MKYRIISHRGIGSDIFNPEGPKENSLESFEKAFELDGVFAVETDLRLTKDKQIICHHDPNIANFSLNYLDYDELSQFHPHVPLLSEVFRKFKNHKFILELKPDEDNEFIVNQIFKDFVGKVIKPEDLMFISFDPEALLLVKNKDISIYCSWIVTNIDTDKDRKYHIFVTKKDVELCKNYGIEEIAVDYRVTFSSIVNYAHDRGIRMGAGMINDKKSLEKILKRGFDVIYSDKPQLIIERLNQAE